MSRQGKEALCITRYAHRKYTRTYTNVCSTHSEAAPRDVSRRSSRQILFRKIGLPLSSTTERRQLCVGGSFRLTNTHVMRVRARLKNFQSYHPDLLLQHPIFPFSLRHTKPRYPTISVYLNHAKCRRNGGYKPASLPSKFTFQRTTILRNNVSVTQYFVCSK